TPRLSFDVTDTGVGMTADQLAMLFQPFVQADTSMTRRFGGTGLGLTISKRLAEMLGGHIDVKSTPGSGRTCTLLNDPGALEGVQRVKDCREALAGHAQPHALEPNAQLTGRILLVEDGLDNRRLLSVYLRQAGAEVTLAEDGKQGCDAALASEST